MASATAEEQFLLELINAARLDPLLDAKRYIDSYSPILSLDPDVNRALKANAVNGIALYDQFKLLKPVAPLAWNDALGTAAEAHSAAMISADQESSRVTGEPALASRVQTAGYVGARAVAENVRGFGMSMLEVHASLMVDWGNGTNGMVTGVPERTRIMSAAYNEIGIDVTADTNANTRVGPYVVTQDFGSRGKVFVTGVAYTDSNFNDFYTIGEGKAGLVVKLGSTSVTSGTGGGYSLEVPGSGTTTINLSGGGLTGTVTVTASILTDNLKLDVVDGNTLLTSGSITVSGAIKEIRVITLAGTTITAGAGAQEIRGNDGDDTLIGGEGNDTLYGGYGNDSLYGGDGNDFLYGENQNDYIDGGAGTDTAVYRDAMSTYLIRTGPQGDLIISGYRDNTDHLVNVELFRFADGVYEWNGSAMVLVPNNAPSVAATQSVQAATGQTKQFTVNVTDPDDDPMAFTVGRVANGTVVALGGGLFNYTPKSGFTGLDSFTVTARDGRGGTAIQTVNVLVSNNDAPTVAATQAIATNQGTPKQFTVKGADINADPLTYSAASPLHGTVTGGANGVFIYTPTSGYTGSDSFAVTVDDGKGGTATQTVNVSVTFGVPAANAGTDPAFQFFAANGQKASVGGTGTVNGTNGFQDITVVDEAGKITFDSSFNRGGDIVRLPGAAADYAVLLNGSQAEFRSADATYLIPVGQAGMALVFGDGVRTLIFSAITQQPMIGNQTIDAVGKQVIAPAEGTILPTGVVAAAAGKVFLAADAEVSLEGNAELFGTNSNEIIHYSGGKLTLDGSFSRGGDTLAFDEAATQFTAQLSGSFALLTSSGGIEARIPIGTEGMTIAFTDVQRELLFDPGLNQVLLGNLVLSSSAVVVG